jgi:hypothetical protein
MEDKKWSPGKIKREVKQRKGLCTGTQKYSFVRIFFACKNTVRKEKVARSGLFVFLFLQKL